MTGRWIVGGAVAGLARVVVRDVNALLISLTPIMALPAARHRVVSGPDASAIKGRPENIDVSAIDGIGEDVMVVS
jgi:hypothetical protein